jgi:hypothetical protein
LRTLPIALVLLSCGAVRSLAAQWQVGIEVAATRYGGSAHDTSSSHVASDGRPGNATAISVRIGRNWRRYGVALRASYAKPGLAVAGENVNLTDKTTGDLFEVVPLVSTRVGGIGPSGAVRLELGPALHLWNLDGDLHARFGALGAAVYEWPVAGRFSGNVQLEGVLSRSWFDPGDTPPEFERRVTWRYGVGLGLRYRL